MEEAKEVFDRFIDGEDFDGCTPVLRRRVMINKNTKFYSYDMTPNKPTSRWKVYYIDDGGCEYPSTLKKFWPKEAHKSKKSQSNGWTYTKRKTLPAYHFYIDDVGTSHEHLLKMRIAQVLNAEYGLNISGDDVNLEVM